MIRSWRSLTFFVLALTLAGLVSADLRARGRWPFGKGGSRAPGRSRGGVLTARDLVLTPGVADPQISPDGRRVVFVVTRSRIGKNDQYGNLWQVPLAGGTPRPLTTTRKRDWGPRFSPDGKHLYFLSTRKGGPQVWRLPLAGGEPQRVSRAALGLVGPLVISRRGDRVLAAGSAYPRCRDDKCNRAEKRKRKRSKVRAELFTGLLYRHWNHWRHGKVSHVWSLDPRRRRVVDLTPGPQDAPPIALGGHPDYDLSPDGREVAFVKNTDKLVATSTNNDVFVMPAAGGRPRRLTTSRANQHSPRYSPDGRYLAYVTMKVPRYEADRQRLALYDRRTRKHRVLTEALDRSVREYRWSPDGKTLYFTAPDRGYVPIFAVSASGGPVKRLVEKVHAKYLRVTPDGRQLVFVSTTTHQPPEIYRISSAGGRPVAITRLQGWVKRRKAMQPVEHLWYTGAAGRKVHAIVVKPPGFRPGRKYPLVVMVHGGPQGMSGDSWHPRWNAQLFAAPGYVVLMPNFHGSKGYGQKFCDAIQGDWGGKPYQDVMRSVDAAIKKYRFIDAKRVCAIGASYGGFMMNWIGGHTNRFRCLITHAGVYDLRSKYGTTEELWFPEREFKGTPWTNPAMYRKWSPSTYIRNWKTPTLVIHGQHDYRVTVGQAMQLFTALQRRGVPSQFLYFPDENHFVQKAQNRLLWWKTMHEFLARYLKGRR